MNAKNSRATLASAAFVYLLLLLRLGYQFGGGDQAEVLPLALYLEDPSLYPHDIYLQSAARVWPNERWLLVQWVRLVPPAYYYGWCLLWHGLFSLLLLVGAQRVAGLFIRDEGLAWLAVILNFVVLYYFAPGGNELYAPVLVASLAAKAVAMWGVYWFFRGRLLRASVLLIPATWFQPLVGLHLAAVFFGVQGFELWRERRGGWRLYLGALALYASFGASWAVYLKLSMAAAGQEVPLSDAEFYDLLFYFRNPNHYDPTAFLLRAYFVTGVLLLAAGYVFRQERLPLGFLGLGLGLFLLGLANALWLQDFSLSALQFFKMAIWLKFLGVVAVCAWLERRQLPWVGMSLAFARRRALILALAVLGLAGLLYASSERFRLRYDWPGRYALDPETDICRQARLASGPEAVFVHPFRFTRFHYHAQRSSFVCFKAISREKGYIQEWAARLQLAYGVSLADAERGSALARPADARYARLDLAAAQRLKAAGATHLIAFREGPIGGLRVVGGNGGYVIYEL